MIQKLVAHGHHYISLFRYCERLYCNYIHGSRGVFGLGIDIGVSRLSFCFIIAFSQRYRYALFRWEPSYGSRKSLDLCSVPENGLL
jgi:hypothetical protein